MMGINRGASINNIMEECIYFYLELHQCFWLLRPMDNCYPLKVEKAKLLSLGA